MIMCPCGTTTRKSFSGIASSGSEFDYCPNCNEDVAYIAKNPQAMRARKLNEHQLLDDWKEFAVGTSSIGPLSMGYNPKPTSASPPPYPNSSYTQPMDVVFGTSYFIAFKTAVALGITVGDVQNENFFPKSSPPQTLFELELLGFLPCDGKSFSNTTFPELFAVLGHIHGTDPFTRQPLTPNYSMAPVHHSKPLPLGAKAP